MCTVSHGCAHWITLCIQSLKICPEDNPDTQSLIGVPRGQPDVHSLSWKACPLSEPRAWIIDNKQRNKQKINKNNNKNPQHIKLTSLHFNKFQSKNYT